MNGVTEKFSIITIGFYALYLIMSTSASGIVPSRITIALWIEGCDNTPTISLIIVGPIAHNELS